MNRFRKVFRSEDGFTLIELLVVIAVLAILAALAVPRLGGLTNRARMSEATNALNSLKTAAEMMNVQNGGEYPSDSDFDNDIGDYIDNLAEIEEHWDIEYTHEDSADTVEIELVGRSSTDYDGLSRSITKDYSGDAGVDPTWQID